MTPLAFIDPRQGSDPSAVVTRFYFCAATKSTPVTGIAAGQPPRRYRNAK